MIQKLQRLDYAFTLSIVIYTLAVVAINPFFTYAVNDDWDFIVHVKNFRQGDFVKNSLIDSSFILQGFIAVLWSYIFGFSYPSLKMLTSVFTIFSLYILKKIFDLYNFPTYLRFAGYLTFLFNPFIFPFSITFMTEIYFLFFVLLSIYFYLKYHIISNPKYILLSAMCGSLSVLIRQLGIILVPSILITLLAAEYIKNKSLLVKHWKFYALGLFVFILCIITAFLWPQYNSDNEKPINVILNPFYRPQTIIGKIVDIYYLIPYFGISSLPFGLTIFWRLKKTYKFLVFAVTAVLFNSFYTVNIFKLGNTLYPEGLLIKNNYIQHITLYNNVIFKSLLAALVLLSFFSIIFWLLILETKWKRIEVLGLLFLSLSLSLPFVVHPNFYDRYIVNGLVIFLIFLTLIFHQNPLRSKAEKIAMMFTTAFLSIYVFTLSYDFHIPTKIQWQAAERLKSVKDVGNAIFLSDTYTKYMSIYFKPNGPHIVRAMPTGISYKCYIQRDFTSNPNNFIYEFLSRLSNSKKVSKYLSYPKIYESKTLPGYRPPTKDAKKIIETTNYISFQEYIVGNSPHVVTYCNN